ncbi:hypothetical protein [Sphingomonas koreensis]|nr:hypothetical protein [Sphingomonas koreensis]
MTYGHIAAMGCYIPQLRADRAAMAAALRFSGLGGRGAGHRAVAGWDEDPLTLAVEAARNVGEAPAERLVLATTSNPYYERSLASLAVEALGWPATTRTFDAAGTRRSAVSALADSLLVAQSTLIVAAEKRLARPGSAQHLQFGDGAASALTDSHGAARLIGHASLARDFLDFHSSRDHPAPYAAEERFVRDTAGRDIIVPTIAAACRSAQIDASAVAHAAIHEPLAGMGRDIARAAGLTATNHAEALTAGAGDLGAAHPLFALALAFAAAKPGDRVLLVGFGSGCDALIFELDAPMPGAQAAADALAHGLILKDHARFLSLTGAIDLDWGMRAELEQKAQPTVIERHGRDTIGFIGARDAAGNVQFPKSRIPVRPGADGPETMEAVRLADVPATLVSVTADRLNFTPDPPFWFGLVQFENGARVLMELTDANPTGFAVGDALRMRLRIKSHDRRRGLRTYFWKAAPAARAQLEV